jgi:hypothetical protein
MNCAIREAGALDHPAVGGAFSFVDLAMLKRLRIPAAEHSSTQIFSNKMWFGNY